MFGPLDLPYFAVVDLHLGPSPGGSRHVPAATAPAAHEWLGLGDVQLQSRVEELSCWVHRSSGVIDGILNYRAKSMV